MEVAADSVLHLGWHSQAKEEERDVLLERKVNSSSWKETQLWGGHFAEQ